MKAVIVEDERAAVRNLTALLTDVTPEMEVIAVLDSISESVEWFKEHKSPDLVFMDIHLADGSAFEIFRHIEIACPVIFTTAYDEYALKAFKVNSVDYLLKPIGAEDVRNALEKAGAFSYGDRRTGVRRRYTRINPDVETTGELQNSFSGSPKGR